MSVLLIDAGNTRIKWAQLSAGELLASRAAVHAKWDVAQYARRLLGGSAGSVERILVSSVAGPQVNAALRAAARRFKVRIEFVKVPSRGGGITVGYLEPWRLGVDRFVSLVGAHQLFPALPVCVVSIGTAMTLDLLNAAGRHLGGAIVPGPALMVETLLSQTYGIRRRAQGGARQSSGPFGRSTRDAIQQGARYAAAAAIGRLVEEAVPRVPRAPLLVLTGGGVGGVCPLLAYPAVTVPDLVLRGLAVLTRAAQPRRH
jgi:type III pantothenate kinase